MSSPAVPPFDDKPLTRPMLVSGSFDNRFVIVPAIFAAVFLAIGLYAAGKTGPDPFLAAFFLVLGSLFAAPSLATFFWLLARRRWLEVTLGGFVLSERRGKKRTALPDESVISLRRDFKTNSNGETRFRITLDVWRGDGRVERLACSYVVYMGQPDPLSAFWDRLAVGVARRTRESLPQGGALVGRGWHLDAAGLHVGRDVTALERVQKVGYIERRLCVWRDEEERPFLRLPCSSSNIQPLGQLLWEEICARPEPRERPLAGKPLGRVILERRSSAWVLGLAVVLASQILGFFLIRVGLTHPPPEDWVRLGVLIYPALLLLVGVAVIWQGRRVRLVFHENGVSQPGRRPRQLLYGEIEQVAWKRGPGIVFVPFAGLEGRLPISYWQLRFFRRDEDLEAMRDHVCQLIACRWAERFGQEPIVWTGRLRFLPGGLEYRPRGLLNLGDVEPVTVPYHLTGYRIENGQLLLFVPGSRFAACKEKTDTPNLYVGAMLLTMIYQNIHAGQQQQQSPPGVSETAAARAVLPSLGTGQETSQAITVGAGGRQLLPRAAIRVEPDEGGKGG